MDKPAADPEKVISQLSESGIIVESRGGKTPCVKISAKIGDGVEDLIELILLVGEMEELKGDSTKSARGVVIESYLDSQRGPTATLLVKDGALKLKDYVATGSTYGSIKLMENFQGVSLSEAPPSTPVLVIGLNDIPQVGEKFFAEKDETAAKQRAEEFAKEKFSTLEILAPESSKKILDDWLDSTTPHGLPPANIQKGDLYCGAWDERGVDSINR